MDRTQAPAPLNSATAAAQAAWFDGFNESIAERLERLRGELCSLHSIIEMADFSLRTEIRKTVIRGAPAAAEYSRLITL